ncbi:MAG: lipopolysaccharide biosynthesis protein [Eubacteriales bacterium]|nr:lipopolysaccharide biosynthesis protein [Eubacteriales bacterium]
MKNDTSIYENNNNLTQQAFSGMIWKFLEKIGGQGIQFIIQIVLARLLLAEEYGLVGLLTIFIAISDVFILQGLTTALIQKKNADDIDFSSVFFANIVISLLLYAILFLIAPLIAIFYNEPQLVNIMRVLSLNVIIGAIPAVHNAILSRNLDFKKSFYRNIANTLTQGIVGITLALLGFGVWALVYSKIAGTMIGAIVLWITVCWKPRKVFSVKRIKKLFSFSSRILGTNLLNTIFSNIHSLIIGRYYTASDLGYYQRGQQIPQMAMGAVDGSMTAVLYPAFSKIQNDMALLNKALRRSIKTSMYVVLPVLFGFLATARPLTLILLTEKWLPSVPFMQLACIVCMFWPLSHRTHALNAIGKSNVTFKLSLIGKSITLILIFACIHFGIYAIMLGSIGASCVTLFITTYFVNKHIGYSLKELAADVIPSLLLSITMCGAVLLLGTLDINIYILLGMQILLGILIYISGSILLKFDSYHYLLNYVKRLFKKMKKG